MRNRLSRREFLALTGGMLVATAAAACTTPSIPSSSEGGASAQPAAESVTINIWGATGLVWDAAYEIFTEQTGIGISNSDAGDVVFGDQKYLTAAAAGTGPDAAWQNRHTFLQFAAKGLYQDITARFDADGYDRNDFAPVQLAETTWEGDLYGLPWGTDVRYLYWNTEFFADAGLDPASPPTTWDELDTYAAQLNVKNGDEYERYGFVPYLFGNSWMWLYGFLNKAPAISEDKRTILCDDQRWIDALQWMVNFYDKNVGDFEIANAFNEATQSAGLGQPFVAGRTAMSANGNWFIADLLRSPGVEWDVAPMPIPTGGVKSTWSCGFSYVLAPDAQHADEGWEFMKWVTGTDGWHARAAAVVADTQRTWEREQIEGDPQYWPELACYLPALQMLEDEYVSKLGAREQKAWALSIDALENWTHGCGSEMGVAALEYWVEMDNSVRAALSHDLTPEAAMVQCKEKVQEATDRAWQTIESSSRLLPGLIPVGEDCICATA
ncbi:MAG TPA: extracellular solute-binding protein [Caldilineaceae bacterium]|nr:extracellular solute-binding protein [Caldilineaceae bacterium]